jgi:STE24 endopeptidase
MQLNTEINITAASKIYTEIKNRNSLISITLNLALLAAAAFSPLSNELADYFEFHFANTYIQFLLFVFTLGLLISAIELPFSFYNSYIIEHQFGLSNQTVTGWILENIKSSLISAVFIVPVALVFFQFISLSGDFWWFFFSVFIFIFSLFTSWIAPALIFPLFYKFSAIENEALRKKLLSLTKGTKLNIREVYSFNLSKNTKKANAALAGFGRTKRIIIADTLLNSFTDDEIHTVFAHEMGHYTLKHIPIMAILSFFVIMATCASCAVLFKEVSSYFGYISVTQIAGTPMLLFFISIFSLIMTPVLNYISRRFEIAADRYAVDRTGDRASYISALTKLAEQNLSDREPGALYEFIFYSHPSIGKRIRYISEI